jgi:hypothetical protein
VLLEAVAYNQRGRYNLVLNAKLPMADQSKIVSVKTAVFKLHNPSQRKRAMLDYALLQNHLAYTKALRAVPGSFDSR